MRQVATTISMICGLLILAFLLIVLNIRSIQDHGDRIAKLEDCQCLSWEP